MILIIRKKIFFLDIIIKVSGLIAFYLYSKILFNLKLEIDIEYFIKDIC